MKGILAKVEVLSHDEIEAIHKASLRILERIGIKVPEDECLSICERVGARVDRSSGIVKIPVALMEEVLSYIRARSLNENQDAYDGKLTKLTGNISTQVYVVDYMAGERRLGLLDDVMKGIALVQRLENFPLCNAVVVPSDVDPAMSDIVSYQKIYCYSRKPGGTYILSPVSAEYIIQMSKVAGRKAEYLLETVSPLQFRKESLETALVFAKHAQSIIIAPMVMGGATGPVTVAGTVTLQNAEVLACLFIVYALTGKFCGYDSGTHSIDLGTMLCSFGSPNQALFGMCIAQLSRFYGLKTINNSGLTDALVPDFQAGFEKACSAIFSSLAGSFGIAPQGIVGADQGISLEQLVIDNEWLDAVNYILEGVKVDEDTIAYNLIESVGIGGNYVAEEHTALNMRMNYWRSRLFNRDAWDVWEQKGKQATLDNAHEFVENAIRDYRHPEPVIDKSKFDDIEYIVKCASRRLNKMRRA